MGILKIEKRWKKGGGQSSNEYTITTKHIYYKTSAEGTSLSDSDEENEHESQKGTLEGRHESQKGVGDESQKGTHNIINSNSLNLTTTAREDFQNFEFDEVRKSLIQKEYNLTDNEIQLALLNFKAEPKYRDNPPINPPKTFTNWLFNEGMAKLKRESQKQSYQPKSYQPEPNRRNLGNLTITQGQDESMEDFEIRIQEKEEEGYSVRPTYKTAKDPTKAKALIEQARRAMTKTF